MIDQKQHHRILNENRMIMRIDIIVSNQLYVHPILSYDVASTWPMTTRNNNKGWLASAQFDIAHAKILHKVHTAISFV